MGGGARSWGYAATDNTKGIAGTRGLRKPECYRKQGKQRENVALGLSIKAASDGWVGPVWDDWEKADVIRRRKGVTVDGTLGKIFAKGHKTSEEQKKKRKNSGPREHRKPSRTQECRIYG